MEGIHWWLHISYIRNNFPGCEIIIDTRRRLIQIWSDVGLEWRITRTLSIEGGRRSLAAGEYSKHPPQCVPVRYWNQPGSAIFTKNPPEALFLQRKSFRSSGGIPVAIDFHQKHTISHQNPSGEVMFSTGKESLVEISPEGLPLTQNPTGSVSALPVSLPAGTLRGGVLSITS